MDFADWLQVQRGELTLGQLEKFTKGETYCTMIYPRLTISYISIYLRHTPPCEGR